MVRLRVLRRPSRLSATVPPASRVLPPSEEHQIGASSEEAHRVGTILSQPNRRRVSTDRPNRVDRQSVLSLEGGLHLRLASISSPADASQGWGGRRGLARVRVDTALRPQDPAVLIIPGPTEAARDPVVDFRVQAVPPHYVLPWATVEMVLPCDDSQDATSPSPRPAAALELLRGSVVRSGGVVHLMVAPTDPTCRSARLLCRRSPEFVIPTRGYYRDHGDSVWNDADTNGVAIGAEDNKRSGRRNDYDHRSSGSRGRKGKGEAEGAGRAAGKGEREYAGARGDDLAEAEHFGVEKTRHLGENDGRPGEASSSACFLKGATGIDGRGWVERLHNWGVITACSEVVIPHEALDVRYHDLEATEDLSEPAWVEAILSSHATSVVDDICASLVELTSKASTGDSDGPIGSPGNGVGGAMAKAAYGGRSAAGGGGALLVHGPPGVGKTCLVEAVARRLRCRVVKLSPGRLAAAAGVHADRILQEAFRYSRLCVSERVLLLLDSIDRLTPAPNGDVGATRGDVDAGVLNAFVLAVEKGRHDISWRGRVALVGVTSWPEHVHPNARRCADREVLVPPPSQPMRARILRNALQTGGSQELGRLEGLDSLETQEAFVEVVGLCQGFTAGDMCTVAATALGSLVTRGAHSGGQGEGVERGNRSRLDEALRSAFRQVRSRVSLGRAGAGGGGGSTSVSGVPNVRWSEVGGLERAKRAVREIVVWPARYPEAFRRMGITPASGLLLFGPPGTGKTLLAKAAATETGATFVELKVSDVVRGEIGESEKAIDRAFRVARELAPSIIFIDEFQALFASRDLEGGTSSRLASQLLVCMDELARWRDAGMWDSRGGAENDGGSRAGAGSRHDRARLDAGDNRGGPPSALSGEGSGSGVGARTWEANVMVLAATNAPEAVDTAFLRPGRFDEIVYAGLPDDDGRKQILRAAKARMEGAVTPKPPVVTKTAAQAPFSQGEKGSSTEDKEGRRADTRADTTAGIAVGKGNACQVSPCTSAAPVLIVADAPANPLGICGGPAPAPAQRVSKLTSAPAATCTDDTLMVPPRSSLVRTPMYEGGAGFARWADDVDEAWLSRQTQGYSGADLNSLVRNAAMAALRDQKKAKGGEEREIPASFCHGASSSSEVLVMLARRHFEEALASTQPSSGLETVAKHESWARQWHVV